jgi:hypothetical protein
LTVKFEIYYDTFTKLEQNLGRLPNKLEKIVNEFLHTEGVEIATEEITILIPNSSWKDHRLNKRHARDVKWSRSENHYLGFTIKSRGGAANRPRSFGYLVFPNEGRGPSNPLEQRFMERGIKNATPKILHRLSNKIEKVIKEEL